MWLPTVANPEQANPWSITLAYDIHGGAIWIRREQAVTEDNKARFVSQQAAHVLIPTC